MTKKNVAMIERMMRAYHRGTRGVQSAERICREIVAAMILVVRMSNPADRTRGIEGELLVDSGALFSVVPATELRRLGMEPKKVERVGLADGTSISRPVGIARFEVADGRAAHP